MDFDFADEFAFVSMYQVVNGQSFFDANRGHEKLCSRPIRWLGVAPDPRGFMWILFGDRDDYRSFTRCEGFDGCAAVSYSVSFRK